MILLFVLLNSTIRGTLHLQFQGVSGRSTKKKRPKSSSPQKKKKPAKKRSKKRKKDKNSSYEQELRAEAKFLNEDGGERSKRAGFGDVAPVEDPDSVTEEPNLFGPVPEAHR
jgi:hypothetical protein